MPRVEEIYFSLFNAVIQNVEEGNPCFMMVFVVARTELKNFVHGFQLRKQEDDTFKRLICFPKNADIDLTI